MLEFVIVASVKLILLFLLIATGLSFVFALCVFQSTLSLKMLPVLWFGVMGSCAYCLKEYCHITLVNYRDFEFYLCDDCLLFLLRTSDAYGRALPHSSCFG